MPWYLHLALKQLFPSGRKFPFFTAMSMVGVCLGVALMIIVMSVMGGAGFEIHKMIVDSEGDIQVKAQGAIDNYRQVLQTIDGVQGVEASTPTASGAVMIELNSRAAYPFIRGLDLETIQSVAKLDKYMVIGSVDQLDDDSVILSSQLAGQIGASVGDTIDVYSPLLIFKIRNNEVFFPKSLKVVGILQFGHQQLDSSVVYMTLRTAQDIYGMGTTVHAVDVRVKPGVDVDDEVRRINAVLPPDIRAFSWEDSFADFLWILNLEKSTILFMLLFIVVVAAFSMMSSLLTSVIRKTREIGVLSALGSSPWQIAVCFCSQGLFIGVFGTLLGLGLGFGALAIRNDVVLTLAKLTQRQEVLQRFYMFAEVPAHTDPMDVVKIVVFTILITTVSGLFPAWRAAKLNPVEALRSE